MKQCEQAAIVGAGNDGMGEYPGHLAPRFGTGQTLVEDAAGKRSYFDFACSLSARSTFSAVMGISLMRMPHAS